MNAVNSLPEPAPEHPLVYVQYGRCAGLPPLTGIGRITDTKVWRGLTYVYVEPVEKMPLPKWVPFHQVQYVLVEMAEVA